MFVLDTLGDYPSFERENEGKTVAWALGEFVDNSLRAMINNHTKHPVVPKEIEVTFIEDAPSNKNPEFMIICHDTGNVF